jgi:hypothetical protein
MDGTGSSSFLFILRVLGVLRGGELDLRANMPGSPPG